MPTADEFEIQDRPSGYASLRDTNELKFRMFGQSIKGWQYWITDDEGKRKPIRVHTIEEVDMNALEINKFTGEPDVPTYFWAFVVFNYGNGRIQILQIDKKTIQKEMAKYIQDPDYGHPSGYDIVITKNGEGMKTKYSVIAKPPKPVEKHIQQFYDESHIDLSKLFEGGDPFGKKDNEADSLEKMVEEVGL